jgi:hypothetical protein
MTAVIGILNKSAVAIAADSAATFSNAKESKTINNANKIFTLSKYKPVGIAIYNSSAFIDTPWEVLIKEFRRQLGVTAYNTLDEYRKAFFAFVKSRMSDYNMDLNSNRNNEFIVIFFKTIVEKTLKELDVELKEENKKIIKKKLNAIISNNLERLISENKAKLVEFNKYSFIEFEKVNRDDIIENLPSNILSLLSLSKGAILKLLKIYYYYFSRSYFNGPYTGLVFVGFGETELYPNCISCNVGSIFNQRIRYSIEQDDCVHIGPETNAAIMPFAQRDVIDTILSGIDSNLEKHYQKVVGDTFGLYKDEISKLIRTELPELADQLDDLDKNKFIDELNQNLANYKLNKHVIRLMGTISGLSKDDLADMAESLVYLTYLKRRMTSAQESVGGPIDVAVISKADGFIWIKRKHYFKPELNTNFVNNYLKF